MASAWLDQIVAVLAAHPVHPALAAPASDAAVALAGPYQPLQRSFFQVIGSAAEACRQAAAVLWPQAQPGCLVIAAEIDPRPWQTLAAELGLGCVLSDESSSASLWRLRALLAERCAPRQTLHATLVEILGLGVLLLGASGSGKSELALDLLAQGHRLVADDAVEMSRPASACLLGRCAPLLSGFLEVRGLGILDIRAAYGGKALSARARVDLAIQLDPGDISGGSALERLHGRRDSVTILGIEVPRIALPARLRVSAAMIEAACRDHWLRQTGYTGSQALVARQSAMTAKASLAR